MRGGEPGAGGCGDASRFAAGAAGDARAMDITPEALDAEFTLPTAATRLDFLSRRDNGDTTLNTVRTTTTTTGASPTTPTSLDVHESLELLALGEVIARKAHGSRLIGMRAALRGGADWAQIGAALDRTPGAGLGDLRGTWSTTSSTARTPTPPASWPAPAPADRSAPVPRPQHRLDPVARLQLGQHPRHVVGHRLAAHAQRARRSPGCRGPRP